MAFVQNNCVFLSDFFMDIVGTIFSAPLFYRPHNTLKPNCSTDATTILCIKMELSQELIILS